MTTNIDQSAAQDTRLWCLHHIGADEVHAAPDFATAQRWADYANRAFAAHADISRFVVAVWPWDADRHAADLPKSIADWTVPLAPTDIAREAWMPIETAPYDTPVEIQVGRMTMWARLMPGAGMTEDEKTCDQWQAEYEGEHPPCWSGGACWSSNEDEIESIQPTAWFQREGECPTSAHPPEQIADHANCGEVERVARAIDPGIWARFDNSTRPYVEGRGASQDGEQHWYALTYPAGCRSAEDVRQWWLSCEPALATWDVHAWRQSLQNASAAIAALSTHQPNTTSVDVSEGAGGEREALAGAVRTIMARCEALEDEAADDMAKDNTEHSIGYWRGQKSTAKSIRRHLHDLTRTALASGDTQGTVGEGEG